jgi:hypothetical protein
VERRFDALDAKIDRLRESIGVKIDGLQWRTTALILATWSATVLAIIFHK